MLGVIGKKIGMTQVFDADENLAAVTVLEVEPCPVVQVKTQETDGYAALRVGYGETKAQRLNGPDRGVFDKAGLVSCRALREFRLEESTGHNVGDALGVDLFEPGERVDVTGRSKGRGFQGGVKRHGFHGGPKTHGQSDRHRAPGSIGQSSSPSRVFKGMRMAGHMGDRQVTTKGLKVVGVDAEKRLLLIAGAVPGSRGSMVLVKKVKQS